MESAAMLPFNIDLLIPDNENLRGVGHIKVLDINEGFSKNFHPDGLFSTQIFGKVGEERRNRSYGYIDLYIDIFHPVIHRAIEELKGLYGEIISGKSFATFNKEIGDFEKSDLLDGETGYSFFLKHFHQIKFEERPSPKREFNIKLVNKYRKNCMFTKLIVMPAGLRDYTVDENNKPSEDEINGLYRRVMAVAAVISNVNAKDNAEYLDEARYNLQQRVNEIYDYIVNLLEGKNKLFQGKWASRKIFDSTRNVITPSIYKVDEFFTDKSVSINQTQVGLYQYLRAILPLAVKQVRDTYLREVFVGANSPAVLVNKRTMKKELVHLDTDHHDDWMTYEGIEKIASRFGQEENRDDVIEIEGYYLGLIYKDEKSVRFMQDIDELPDGYDRKNVKPISMAELLYLSVFQESAEIPCFFTRYPITGYGSVYPSYVYLRTTVLAESVKLLGPNWEEIGVCHQFPIRGEAYYNSMSPSSSHLGRLGADHDGDACSLICMISEDSKEEIAAKLGSRNYYVGVNGKMAFSYSDDVADLVFGNVTART